MLNAELRLIYLSLREIGLASELSRARSAPQCPELDRELLGPSRPFGRAARGLHFCGEHRTDAVRHVRPERSEHRRVAFLGTGLLKHYNDYDIVRRLQHHFPLCLKLATLSSVEET